MFAYVRSKQRIGDEVGLLKDIHEKLVDGQQRADLLNYYTNENIEKVPQPDQKFNSFKRTDNEKLRNLDITEYNV